MLRTCFKYQFVYVAMKRIVREAGKLAYTLEIIVLPVGPAP